MLLGEDGPCVHHDVAETAAAHPAPLLGTWLNFLDPLHLGGAR